MIHLNRPSINKIVTIIQETTGRWRNKGFLSKFGRKTWKFIIIKFKLFFCNFDALVRVPGKNSIGEFLFSLFWNSLSYGRFWMNFSYVLISFFYKTQIFFRIWKCIANLCVVYYPYIHKNWRGEFFILLEFEFFYSKNIKLHRKQDFFLVLSPLFFNIWDDVSSLS